MCEYKRLYADLVDDHSVLLQKDNDSQNFISKFLSIWGLVNLLLILHLTLLFKIESSFSCTKSPLQENLSNPELFSCLEKSWGNIKVALGGVSGAHVAPNAAELIRVTDLEQKLAKESSANNNLKDKKNFNYK